MAQRRCGRLPLRLAGHGPRPAGPDRPARRGSLPAAPGAGLDPGVTVTVPPVLDDVTSSVGIESQVAILIGSDPNHSGAEGLTQLI